MFSKVPHGLRGTLLCGMIAYAWVGFYQLGDKHATNTRMCVVFLLAPTPPSQEKQKKLSMLKALILRATLSANNNDLQSHPYSQEKRKSETLPG